MSAKAAFFEVEAWEREFFQKELPGFDLVFVDGQPQKTKDPQALSADAISVFIGAELNPATLEKFPRLQLVCTRSTGYDHVDLGECARRGITVCNVPTYGARTVAEFTFALILALSRKLEASISRVRQGGSFSLDGLRGFDLYHKTLGVIGTGHIGTEAIRIARGFQMAVLATDPNPNPQLAHELGVRYTSLDDLLAASDVISLHVPHVPSTHHLLNRDNLRKVKRGALLINTARGGLVEPPALIEALLDGRLGGAALDVLEEEGAIREERELLLYGHPEESQLRALLHNNILMKMPNVIVTPHNAFNTQEALNEIVRVTAENVRSHYQGIPRNVVAQAQVLAR